MEAAEAEEEESPPLSFRPEPTLEDFNRVAAEMERVTGAATARRKKRASKVRRSTAGSSTDLPVEVVTAMPITMEEARDAFNDLTENCWSDEMKHYEEEHDIENAMDIPFNELQPSNHKHMRLLDNYFNEKGCPGVRGSVATPRVLQLPITLEVADDPDDENDPFISEEESDDLMALALGLYDQRLPLSLTEISEPAEAEPAEPEPDPSEGPQFYVNVRFGDRAYTIELEPKSSVAKLKHQIAAAAGLSPKLSRDMVVRNGENPLHNPRLQMKSAGILAGSTLFASIIGRGGGARVKTQQKKSGDSDLMKQFIIKHKKDAIKTRYEALNLAKIKAVEETMTDANKRMSSLWLHAEKSPDACFKHLMSKVSNDNIGIDKETSPLMMAYMAVANKPEARIEALEKMIMKDSFPRLYDLATEVGGLLETSSLTFEMLMMSAFTNEGSNWKWASITRAIEDEITVRVSERRAAQDRMDVDSITVGMGALAT
jgi:hypothetical protein